MKDERLEILKMLQDGIVTAEEAEKLLSALDKGEKESKSKSSYEGNFSFGNFFSNFDKGFSDLGKTVGDLFENISNSGRYRDYIPVVMEGNSYEPGDSARIEISQPGRGIFNGSCDIAVLPSPDEALHLNRGKCEVLRKDGVVALLCSGDCEIAVPEKMAEITVQLFNGSIDIDGIGAPLRVETINGDIVMRKGIHPARLKTVSGNIRARLARGYEGNTELKTVSGGIELSLPGTFSGLCESTTISGRITCRAGENTAEDHGSEDFRKSIEYRFGGGDPSNRIFCKTVSGNVELESDEYTG